MRQLLKLLMLVVVMSGMVSATLAQTASVSVTPTSGGIGTTFNVTASGLMPNTDYKLAFIHSDTNTVVFSTNRTSNASGQLAMNVVSEPTDTPGQYRVEVQSGSTVVGSATFMMTADAQQGQPNAGGVQLRVIPETGDIGSTYDIIASGLQPDELVTLSINQPDGAQVYNRTLNADPSGTLSVEIFTQAGDAPGIYTATLSNGSTTLATDTFTVEASAAAAGELSITSEADEAGTKHIITITNVKRFANLSVAVHDAATNDQVFFTRVRASVDGIATVEFISDASIAPGNYVVKVNEGDAEIASGSLTVNAANSTNTVTADAPNLTITPVNAPAGTLRIITASGLFAGEAVTVEVTQAARIIFTTSKNADINGNIALSVSNLQDAGDYQVNLKRADNVVAASALTVEAETVAQPTPEATPVDTAQQPGNTSTAQVTIEPTAGPIGTVYNVRVTGLAANETVTIAIMLNARTVFASERTSDATGVATLSINSEEGDAPGAYSVEVRRGDTAIASTSFQIGEADVTTPPTTPEAPQAANLLIAPPSGSLGTNHVVTVTGLQPNESVTINVVFGGNTVYTTDRTADVNGAVAMTLATEAGDAPGDYVVNVVRGGDIIATSTLTLTSDTAQPGQTTPEAAVSIAPEAGPIGTSHAVTINGLQPNETVTLDVLYQGDVVYTTDRVADRSGVVTIKLKADPGDPAGIYTVQIKRNDTLIAEGALTVEGGTAITPENTTTQPATTTGSQGNILSTAAALTINETEKRFTFTGNEGDLVLIRVASDEFDTFVSLQDNAGTELAYNDDSGGSLNSVIGPFPLPADGQYTVIVSSYDVISGSEDAVVEGNFTLDVATAALTTLQYGTGVTADFSAQSDIQFYSVQAQVGDVMLVRVDSAGNIDTSLTLIDPTGVQILTDDDSGAGFDPEITRYVVLIPGEYIVSLSAFTSGETGAATLVVERQAARDLSSGVQQLRVNAKQINDVVTLNASANQPVLLNVRLLNGNTTGAALNVYQDGVVIMTYSAAQIPDGTTLGFVAPASGLVTILLESDGTATSTVEISTR